MEALSIRQKKKERNRQEIIEAGIKVFCDKGLLSASIHDIVSESGLARGTFYNYFKTKEEVWNAIFQESVKNIHKLARERRQESTSGKDFIRNLVEHGIKVLSIDPFPALIYRNAESFRDTYMSNVGSMSIITLGAKDMIASGYFGHLSNRNTYKFAFSIIGCGLEILVQSRIRGDNFLAEDITEFITENFSQALGCSEKTFQHIEFKPAFYPNDKIIAKELAAHSKKDRSRDRLVGAAIELYIEKGLLNTNIDEIVLKADLSRGTFYNYFQTKEEIWKYHFNEEVKFTIQEGRKMRQSSQTLQEYLYNVTYVSAVAYSKDPFPALITKNEGVFRRIFLQRVDEYSFYDMLLQDLVDSGFVDGIKISKIKKSLYGIIGSALEMLIQSYINKQNYSPEEISLFVANVFSHALKDK